MLGLGPFEFVIILIVVIIIFGASRLPQLGEALGKGIKNFKQATDEKSKPAALDVTPSQPDSEKQKDPSSPNR